MRAMVVMMGMVIGSYAGWYLGMFMGYGGAIILGGIGTGVGMYLAQKLNKMI